MMWARSADADCRLPRGGLRYRSRCIGCHTREDSKPVDGVVVITIVGVTLKSGGRKRSQTTRRHNGRRDRGTR